MNSLKKDDVNVVIDELKKMSNLHLDIKNSINHKDGRIQSACGETIICDKISQICKYYNIPHSIPDKRDYFDVKIQDSLINIKITKCNTPDNANCKLGIYYALVGKEPLFGNQISWYKYWKHMKDGLINRAQNIDDIDYYFLVFNKNNNEIYFVGLKELTKVRVNGNNLPFQINWLENKIPKKNSYKEAYNMLIGTFIDSAQKRAECYDIIKELDIKIL